MSHSSILINHILDHPLQYAKGVGPKKAEAFKALGLNSFKKLILHLPNQYVDRREMTEISKAIDGQILSQIVTIQQILLRNKIQKITRIICFNHTGIISLIYFNIAKQFLEQFKIGSKIVISGKVELRHGEVHMPHPDVIAHSFKAQELLIIEPIYPATARLSSKHIAITIKEVMKVLPQMPEWLPFDLIDKFKLPNWNRAISIIHQPKNNNDLSHVELAISRLALDEIIAEQILLERSRNALLSKKKVKIEFPGILQKDLLKELPFQLTSDQTRTLKEISQEQKSEKHMMRMLQGDVGSGKTIVAFFSIINVVEAGFQSILMAPTELLAKQHFALFCKLLKNHTQINVNLLISNLKQSEKKIIYDNIASGKTQIIIGTHALIQQNIHYFKPGLIIIDEQQRFGVMQRFKLLEKSLFCDLLMMSATPIPRTLNMMYYGNISVSKLSEKPLGRLPIITSVLSSNKISTLIANLQIQLRKGEKAYWICPLIEESESLSLKNVHDRYQALQSLFDEKVAFIHSKTKDRDNIMSDFASNDGKIKIIVATTVIEVGVDVSDATIMIIENAEHFGLSQMHQLRGRVGRGNKQSYCILLYSHPLSDIAKQRLDAMRNSNDGFFLAEQDLQIRGGGKVTGIKQSGKAEFLIYDLIKHQKFLDYAKKLSQNESFCKNQSTEILLNLYKMSNFIDSKNDQEGIGEQFIPLY